jgi:uncharacterized FlaG/YvyC family protein
MGVNTIEGQGLAASYPERVAPASAPLPRTIGDKETTAPEAPNVSEALKKARAAASDANEARMRPVPTATQTRMRIDKESNRIITQIIGENNEVLKQIPPDDLLRFAARFRKLQGLLFDELA